MKDETKVRLVSLERSATFTVEMPERAVRALRVIGAFGSDAFIKAIATTLSEGEAKSHSEGLRDLVEIGGQCALALELLSDARCVMDGSKVAVEPDRSSR